MYIKHLIGPRNGEIEDIEFLPAKAKVESGEAEDVFGQLPRPTEHGMPVMAPPVLNTRLDRAPDMAEKVDVSLPATVERMRRSRRR